MNIFAQSTHSLGGMLVILRCSLLLVTPSRTRRRSIVGVACSGSDEILESLNGVRCGGPDVRAWMTFGKIEEN